MTLLLGGCMRDDPPPRSAEVDPSIVVVTAPPTAEPRGEAPPATPRADPPEERAAIRVIQQALVERGFAPGYPDGAWGANTGLAYKQFEASAGIDPDGVPDRESLTALLLEEDDPDAIATSDVQRVRGVEARRPRSFARAFWLGAGSGFLLAAILAAVSIFRQRAAS